MKNSSTQKKFVPPKSLNQVNKLFTHWRNTHPPRTRFSEELWLKAVSIAKEYGPTRTAKVLGLDYYSLKKRISEAFTVDKRDTIKTSKPTFVEVFPPVQTECIIEMEDREGSKMRISLKGDKNPDLVSLSRSFWMGE